MRLGILGSLSVTGSTGTEIPVAARRQRVLLAALAVRANHIVSVDQLAELVWDGSPPPRAARTIRVYVTRLRQALGPDIAVRIVTRDPGYLLRVERDELDLLDFENLCRRGAEAVRGQEWSRAADLLAAALRLWRGTPLLDVPSELLRTAELPRLEQLRVEAVEGRVDADLQLGRHQQLVAELRDLVARHPLREHLHAQLMLCLARNGRQAEALTIYRQIEQRLLDELGVEPGAELRRLRHRVLSDDMDTPGAAPRPAPIDVTVPRLLPAGVPHFTGRSREMRSLTAMLPVTPNRGGGVPVAVIAGTAGIGKTALALRWAHHHAEHFPDGQLYANLRGFAPDAEPTPTGTVLRGFLTALGISPAALPAGLDSQADLYRSQLAGKRMLVILDNVRDAEQVRRLLPGTAGCMALVTSRNQLPGLVVIDGATPLSLELLTPDESHELLSARLGEQRATEEEPAVGELIKLCDGLPLALNIIAGRAALRPDQALREMAEELRDTGQRLAAMSSNDEIADPRAVFSWSYDALPGHATRAFRLLGVHPGPDISTQAVASLLATDVPTARDVLDELTAAHLLTEHNPGRFSCHDLLRVYAIERAHQHETEQQRRDAIRRMLDHYLQAARAAFTVILPARAVLEVPAPAPGVVIERHIDRESAMAWCDEEQAVLIALVHEAVAHDFPTHAWQLPHFLSNFTLQTNSRDLWADAQRAALVAVERAHDMEGQAHLHRLLAMALTLSGRHGEAAAHLTSAGELFQQLGDRFRQSSVQHDLAYTRNEQGQTEQALIHEREALRLAQECGYRPAQATALNAIGWYESLRGRHDEALQLCLRALAVFEELDDPQGQAVTLDSIGYAHDRLGHHTEALTWYGRALPLFARIGQRFDRAETLVRMGDTYRAMGDLPAAREVWHEALDVLEGQHHPSADRVRAKLDDR